MKYRYLYQTKENRTVEGEVEAPDRAGAYAAIRKMGIRPQRVIGDDPKPRLAWKRWAAIAILSLALAVSVALLLRRGTDGDAGWGERQQILGDQALIELNAHTGWARCFAMEGERTLALYAQPGWEVDRERVASAEEVVKSLDNAAEVAPNDPREFRHIKAIVAGMKDELRRYLAAGGTAQDYLDRLHERQLAEVACYERAAQKFAVAESASRDDQQLYELWLKTNEGLREMGIRTLPMPERLAK